MDTEAPTLIHIGLGKRTIVPDASLWGICYLRIYIVRSDAETRGMTTLIQAKHI